MNARRIATVAASLALVLATAPPVLADAGSFRVNLEVSGYVPGTPMVPFGVFCDGQGDRQLGIGLDDPTVTVTVDAPTTCRVGDIGGDAGDMAYWADVQVGSPVAVQPGDENPSIAISLLRAYNGEDPQWDSFFQPPLTVFSVDRVELNRYGGLRVSGTLFCPAVAGTPFEYDNYLGMEMRLTQYTGRKTAVHATWNSDIAFRCFDPATPDTPVPWMTMSSASTLPNGEWWIYGTDGRFASGEVLVEAGVSFATYVANWWDEESDTYNPTCSTAERDDGFYDQNGDGFCAYYNDSGARAQPVVKTVGSKTASGGGRRR